MIRHATTADTPAIVCLIRDLAEFERRVAAGEGCGANDWRISAAIASLVAQTAPPQTDG